MTMNTMPMPSPSGKTRMPFKWQVLANYRTFKWEVLPNYRVEQNG